MDKPSQLVEILARTDWFMSALRAVRKVNPPDWLVGGGVIRSIVWDALHEYTTPTPIKDVDVAFFHPHHLTPDLEHAIEDQLRHLRPDVPWEVKNQAAVHLWYERVFGFAVDPLVSSADAIGTWPETATCVAVRLEDNDRISVVAPYGLDDLFHMVLRRNPRRVTEEIFLRRLQDKNPVAKWPKVRVVYG